MKKIILILLTATAFGSYDSSNRTVKTGYGFQAILGTTQLGNTTLGWAFADRENRVQVGGTVTGVKCRFAYTHNADQAFSDAQVALLRPVADVPTNPTTWNVVAVKDISADLTAVLPGSSQRFTLDIDTSGDSWTAVAGDIIGWYFKSTAIGVQGTSVAQAAGQTGFVLIGRDAVGVAFNISQGTRTFQFGGVDYETTGDRALLQEITVSTNEPILLSDATIDPTEAGVFLGVPYFIGDVGQYITLEGVVVAVDNTSLQIDIIGTAVADGADETIETITLDFSNGSENIDMNIASVQKTLTAAEQPDTFDIHIWTNPTDGEIECIFANVTTGQGGGTKDGGAAFDRDISFISITDRSPSSSISIPDNIIRRLILTDSAGGAATVSKLIVHRQPVLPVGDSNFGTKASAVAAGALARVGAKLTLAFSENRHVIRGAGIGGNRYLLSPAASTDLPARWSSFRNDADLAGFRDVIVIPYSGINDIAQIGTNADNLVSYPTGVASVVGKIVSDALNSSDLTGGVNDVIVSTLVVIPVGVSDITAQEVQGQIEVNRLLREIAAATNVPFADNSDYSDGFSGSHLDDDGNAAVANKMALVWENNTTTQRAPAPISGTRPRYSE